MKKQRNLNYICFIRKLAVIRYFYKDIHLTFEEIGIITDNNTDVIQLYCVKLLN